MKFRNCFFEYDGVYSGQYDLRLVYVENSNRNFDSGGNFDFKFGQIPYSHEQLYYGKDYSTNPLQFEIEIMNVDGYIPDTQMTEIKEWLFGKSGWKKFKVLDGRNNVSLRCVLIPIADITERDKYKGLRFMLRNASPFWYGEEKEIEHTGFISSGTLNNNWHCFELNIPNNGCVDTEIFPIISAELNCSQYYNYKGFMISNTEATTVAEGLQSSSNKFVYKDISMIYVDTTYLEKNGEATYTCSLNSSDNMYHIQVSGSGGESNLNTNSETISETIVKNTLKANGYYVKTYNSSNMTGTVVYAKDTLTLDARYAIVDSEKYPNIFLPISLNTDNPLKLLRLHYGTNIIRVYFPWNISKLTFKYTPLYRMGAF